MANTYKNAFYDPTSTATVTVYTAPSNARAIIQNIQVTNESGSKITKASINDASTSTIYQIAYASISGPTICNIAKGPIILEESDSLILETNDTTAITAVVSILEISRDDQNG
jgi:ABC-type transport system involved in Fe-S cluster assembly fused permease/ATPase subunit